MQASDNRKGTGQWQWQWQWQLCLRRYPRARAMTWEFIPLNQILVGDRQRTRIDSRSLNELAWSISTRSLLQAIGVWEDADGALHLVWGGRRHAAVARLAGEGTAIRASDGTVVPLGSIPAVRFSASTALDR